MPRLRMTANDLSYRSHLGSRNVRNRRKGAKGMVRLRL
jgi:hypothetical protein